MPKDLSLKHVLIIGSGPIIIGQACEFDYSGTQAARSIREEGIKVNACSPGFVNSALSRFMGTKSPEDGARIIVKLANDGPDGPTGGFFTDDGGVAW